MDGGFSTSQQRRNERTGLAAVSILSIFPEMLM